VQLVPVAGGLWVANMIGQHGIKRVKSVPPIRYEAIETCLRALAVMALEGGASVHMPRIGCGLAGGEWSKIEPLVRKQLCEAGVEVTVYDLA
jgi:O-acetyl-ADP-ribose deacetylase (regulator of RNase III)